MRPVGSWLERFRRPAGIPAAVTEELDAELLPVFAALDRIEEEAVAIRKAAEEEASRRLDAAEAEAERRLASWRRRADAERTRAELQQRDAITARARALESRGSEEAAEILTRGRERIPALVAVVIACITEGTR